MLLVRLLFYVEQMFSMKTLTFANSKAGKVMAIKILCFRSSQRNMDHHVEIRNVLRMELRRAPCRSILAKYLEQKSLVLITADHKVLNGAGESRNKHRNGVVVQDLAIQ